MPGSGPRFPATLKHYELLRLLGQGGMGMVIEGVDRRDGSRVAVKLLHAHLAASDPTYLDRFEREAHVAALLRSPYTVHLIDYGVEEGQYFLVMEYVEGETLADRLARGALEPDEALRIAAEVARALEEAGARGIVHRDIKPENILLDARGRVKVTDFGIARSTQASGLTMTGGFVGTPAFAAPEQVDGQVDQRSDIYALGVTIYNCLAGHPPFRGRTAMDTLIQHRTAVLPMEPLAHLPDAVQNLVRRCLEKDPLDRYQTASELAGAIDRSRQVLARASAAGPSAAVAPSRQTTPSQEFTGPAAPPPARSEPAERAVPRPGAGGPRPSGGASNLPPGWSVRQEPPPRPPAPPRPPVWKRPAVGLGALGVAAAAVGVGVAVAIASLAGGDDGSDRADPVASPTATATATRTLEGTAAGGGAPTPTPPPPTQTPTPPPTPTPEGGWARINGIRLVGTVYEVTFETNGFTYSLPGIHVHFFFDTVPVSQAGSPGAGPWAVYGGPSPFTDYRVADRPAGARQLCVLVANANHSIRPGTGNCFDLP